MILISDAQIHSIELNFIITSAQLWHDKMFNDMLHFLNKQHFININRILENNQEEGNPANILQ
jgi:hypothetical protein